MIVNYDPPVLVAPSSLDAALLELSTKLLNAFTWLDRAYGKAEKLEEKVDGRKRTYPGLHVGGNEYLQLIPDDNIGNFSFFKAENGDSVIWGHSSTSRLSTKISLILWFNFNDVYGSQSAADGKTIDNVKDLILSALTTMYLSKGAFEVTEIHDLPSTVYDGYSLVYSDPDWIGVDRVNLEAGNLFFMRPYGCLKFDGILTYRRNSC